LIPSSTFSFAAATAELIPNANTVVPDHPQVYVTDKNFTNPRTYTSTLTIEQALTGTLKLSTAFTWRRKAGRASPFGVVTPQNPFLMGRRSAVCPPTFP